MFKAPTFKRRTLESNRRQHRFGAAAVARLEAVFRANPIPSRETRLTLARDLEVSERQVQVWLQNKRQRSKARRLREEAAAKSSQLVVREPAAEDEALQQPAVLEACWREDLEMEVFIQSHAPFQVLWASKDWLNFCGFEQADLKRQTMKIIQGPSTDDVVARELSDAATERRCSEATLINYTKHRVPFRHTISIEPLINSFGQVRLYRARSMDIEVLSDHEPPPADHLYFSDPDDPTDDEDPF